MISVKALKEIANKIGKKDWDFGVDPCSGKGNWNASNKKGFESFVICDCSFNHNSSCHVVSMYWPLFSPIFSVSTKKKKMDPINSHFLLKTNIVAENHMQSCVFHQVLIS